MAANPEGKELWVLLIEKAWAKLSGSYQNSEGGLTSETMEQFTGMPTCNITKNDDLWNNLPALSDLIV